MFKPQLVYIGPERFVSDGIGFHRVCFENIDMFATNVTYVWFGSEH